MSTHTMNRSKPYPLSSYFVALCAAAALHGFATQSLAQTMWDGGGADNNWNTAANWDNDTTPPNPPSNGTATLTFTGTTRTTPNVDTPWNLSTIAFDATATLPFTISNQSITFSNAATLTNNTPAVTHSLTNDLIANTATLAVTANMGGFVLAGDIDLSTGGGAALTIGGAQDTDLSGVISGTGGNITKSGAGTLTLNGANTFDGPVTLNAGTLSLNNNSALGSSTSLIIAGGNLQAGGAARTIADTVNVRIDGDFSITGTQALTIAGDVSLNSFSPTITVSNTGNTIASGVISEVGTRSLTKAGTGSLELSGTNTYTGDTNINAGELIISGSVAGDVNVNTGGTLAIGSDNALGGALNISGGSTLQADGAARTIANSTVVTVNGDFEVTGTQALEIASDIDLSADRTVTTTNTANTEFSGVISESGGMRSFTKAGTETLELSGANTYSGPTTITAGTLKLSNDTALPAASNLIINGGGIEAGNAARIIAGSGTFVVGDDFSVSGSQDLEINRTFDLSANRTVTVTNTGDTVFSGVISETGTRSLTKIGSGSLELAGINTYTGDTNIDAGTLVVSGTIVGDVNVNTGVLLLDGGTVSGDLTLNNTGTLTLSNSPMLNGTALTINGGTLLASGGAQTIALATALGGNFTIAGTQDLTLSSGITLPATRIVTVSNSGNTLFSGMLTGAGGLTKQGSGTLELSDTTNDYNGDTTINAGTLLVSGNLTGTGDVDINNGGTLSLTGAIATNATINNGGTLSATGSGVVTGTTTLNAGGTLSIGNNAPFGTALAINGGTIQAIDAARAINPGTLTLGGDFTIGGSQDLTIQSSFMFTGTRTINVTNTGDTVLAGIISGAGSLTKIGSRTLELSNVNNAYTGDTNINAGTLLLNGRITSNTIVNAAGTLAGNGTITGNLTVNSGGFLNAGPLDNTTTDTLTVSSNLTLNSASITVVEIVSDTAADSYSIGGSITIGSGSVLSVVPLSGFTPTQGNTYTIMTSPNGITGNFDTNDIVSSPAGFQFETNTANAGNDLVLSISITPLANSAVSPNQAGVAAVLDTIRATVTPGSDMETAINQLAMLSVSGLQTALDQIVPDEVGAMSSISFVSNSTQSANVSNRLAEIRLGATGHSTRNLRLANLNQTLGDDNLMLLSQQTDPWMPSDSPLRRITTPDYPWSAFVSGSGTFGEVDTDDGQPGYEFTTGGITAGIDRQVSQNTIVGAMLGYVLSNVDVDSNGGETDVNSVKVGLYGTLYVPGAYINAMIGTGINFYDTDRNINLGATTRTATSDPDGVEFTAMISAGFDFALGNWTVEPIVSAQYTHLTIDDYTETGAGALNLTVDEQNVDSLIVRIGTKFATTVELARYRVIPEFRVFYQSETEEQARSVTARFASGGGGAFNFNTTDVSGSSFVLGAGLTFVSQSDVAAYIDFNTEVGRDNYTAHTIRAGVQFPF